MPEQTKSMKFSKERKRIQLNSRRAVKTTLLELASSSSVHFYKQNCKITLKLPILQEKKNSRKEYSCDRGVIKPDSNILGILKSHHHHEICTNIHQRMSYIVA